MMENIQLQNVQIFVYFQPSKGRVSSVISYTLHFLNVLSSNLSLRATASFCFMPYEEIRFNINILWIFIFFALYTSQFSLTYSTSIYAVSGMFWEMEKWLSFQVTNRSTNMCKGNYIQHLLILYNL